MSSTNRKRQAKTEPSTQPPSKKPNNQTTSRCRLTGVQSPSKPLKTDHSVRGNRIEWKDMVEPRQQRGGESVAKVATFLKDKELVDDSNRDELLTFEQHILEWREKERAKERSVSEERLKLRMGMREQRQLLLDAKKLEKQTGQHSEEMVLGFECDVVPRKKWDEKHDSAWLEAQKASWPEGKEKNLLWKAELDKASSAAIDDKEDIYPVDEETEAIKIDPIALKRLARQGGPDFSDWMFKRLHDPTPSELSIGTRHLLDEPPIPRDLHIVDAKLRQAIFEASIFDGTLSNWPADKHPTASPANLDEIKQELNQLRPASLSIHDLRNQWVHFGSKDRKHNGATADDILSVLCALIIYHQGGLYEERDEDFTNLEPLHKSILQAPRTNTWDGIDRGEVHIRIKKALHKHIVPRKDAGHILPNFLLSIADGKDDVRARTCLAGAAGARAMHDMRKVALRTASPEVRFNTLNDGKALTLSAIYYPDEEAVLEVNAIYVTVDESGCIKAYHVFFLGRYRCRDTFNGFLEASTILRNAREWCEKQRVAVVQAANDEARKYDAQVA